MQKKILKILCVVFALCLFAFTLSACSDGQQSGEPGGHTHNYNKAVVEDKYLRQSASCTSAATYYYSCACGEKGVKFFYDGRETDHVYDQKIESESFVENPITCTEHATYFYSCVCGEVGTETFIGEEEPQHYYDGNGICEVCGEGEE